MQKITARKTKKPWSKAAQTTPRTNDLDKEFLKAVHSLKEAIKEPQGAEDNEVDDDHYFCLSLMGQLNDLEPRFKSMAKLQIMKVFNDIEWSRMSLSQSQPYSVPSLPIQYSQQIKEQSFAMQHGLHNPSHGLNTRHKYINTGVQEHIRAFCNEKKKQKYNTIEIEQEHEEETVYRQL